MTGNPDAVLQLLLTARFGALLFDNWMPKINGTELCRMIRFHDQNCRFSSAPAQSQRAIKRSRLKPVRKAILGRPFDPEELTATLCTAVKIQPTWTTFLHSVFTSLMPRSHPYTFRAPIVSDQPFRVFYPN